MGRIITLDQVKEYAGVNPKRDDATRDKFIEGLIRGAEAAVERITRRRLAPEPALKEVPGEGENPPTFEDTEPVVSKTFATRGLNSIGLPDLREIVSISLAGTTVIADSTAGLTNRGTYFGSDGKYHEEPYTFMEFSALVVEVFPDWLYVEGQRDLTIKGRWGFYPPPDDIVDALCQLVARRYKSKDAQWADNPQAGPSDGARSTFSFARMPPEMKELLSSYQLPRVAIV